MKYKSNEVLIQFCNKTKKQLEHLFRAEKELRKAGVDFDTGYGCGCRDWEFDWSLKGAKVILKKKK